MGLERGRNSLTSRCLPPSLRSCGSSPFAAPGRMWHEIQVVVASRVWLSAAHKAGPSFLRPKLQRRRSHGHHCQQQLWLPPFRTEDPFHTPGPGRSLCGAWLAVTSCSHCSACIGIGSLSAFHHPPSCSLATRRCGPGFLCTCVFYNYSSCCCHSVAKSCPTLWPHGPQHTRLSSPISWSLLKLMSIESVMPSNQLILCCPLLLPSIFPSIRVFFFSPLYFVIIMSLERGGVRSQAELVLLWCKKPILMTTNTLLDFSPYLFHHCSYFI